MRKRPGTLYLGDALSVVIGGVSYPPYLIKFEFSLGQTYILEFGHYEMRVWINDYLIIDPATNQPYKIATPYTYQQAKEMTVAQYKDSMFCTHWDLPVRKLVRGKSDTHTNWYWDTVIIEPDDLVTAPGGVHFITDGHNGVSYAVTAVKDGQESRGGYGAVSTPVPGRGNPTDLPTLSTDRWQLYANVQDWINRWYNQFGNYPGFPAIPPSLKDAYEAEPNLALINPGNVLTIWEQGVQISGSTTSYYGFASLAAGVAAVAAECRYTTEGGPAIYEAGDGMLYLFIPLIRDSDGERFAVVLAKSHYLYVMGTPPALTQYDYNTDLRTITWNLEYRCPVPFLCPTTNTTPRNNKTYTVLDTPSIVANSNVRMQRQMYCAFPQGTGFSDAAKSGELTRDLKDLFSYEQVKAVYDQCLEFVADGVVRPNNVIGWSPSEGATAYNIYRNVHADTIYTGFYFVTQVPPSQLTFEDPDVNETAVELSISPKESGLFFDSPDNYPHVCTFFQQRFVVGSTRNAPLVIAGSAPGFFEDFLLSENPLDTTGAWRFELTSQTSNPIKHIIPIRGLYVLTEAGAFVTSSTGSINASNVNFNQEAYNGATAIPPVIVDRSALYIPLNRQMVSSLSYDLNADAFEDNNMLFSAQHLTIGTLVESLAYARPVSSLVGVTLQDGRLLICTFIPGQEFMAWTEHNTQGQFKQICASTNASGFDEFYFTVLRNGRFVIEKMDDLRPFIANEDVYLDSALKGKFSTEVSRVTGLAHLEGMTVSVLTDGYVQQDKVVSGGAITLDAPALDVAVGLSYEASLETLDLEIAGVPTLRGSMRHIVRAVVEVEDTQDLEWSLNGGDWWPIITNDTSELASNPKRLTQDIPINGAVDYVNGTRIRFRSSYPLRSTINSIVAEVQVG